MKKIIISGALGYLGTQNYAKYILEKAGSIKLLQLIVILNQVGLINY